MKTLLKSNPKTWTRNSLSVVMASMAVSGCKVASQPRPASPTSTDSPSAVYTYFETQQTAINSQTFASNMSKLIGFGMVAPKESTFVTMTSADPRCMYAQEDGLGFGTRIIDIGDVKLSGISPQSTAQTIKKDPQKFTFLARGSIPSGNYGLESTGINGALVFKQEFVIPGAGSNIRLTSGSDATQTLPTPNIPGSTDPNYTIVVNKTQTLKVEFTAPSDARIARVTISDNAGTVEGSVVCYGPTDAPIEFPEGALNYFRSTDDGLITIDFVNTRLNTGDTIKESFVRSYVRHVHGLIDFFTDTHKQTANFGRLRIQ